MKIYQKLLLLFCLTVLLNGCSFFSVFYNNLDYVAKYQLKSMFDLSSDQVYKTDKAIDEFLFWHKKYRLPVYISFINEMKNKINKGLVESDKDWLRKSVENEFLVISNKFLQLSYPIIETLNNNQIDNFEKYLATKNKKFIEDIELSEEKYRKQRYEKILEQFETWLGDLNSSQTKILLQAVNSMQDLRKEYLSYRIEKQKKVIQSLRILLKEKNQSHYSEKKYQKILADLMIRQATTENPSEYLNQEKKNRMIITETSFKISNSLNHSQKEYLFEKLDGYQDDFISLHHD